jgi:hypothetical protein
MRKVAHLFLVAFMTCCIIGQPSAIGAIRSKTPEAQEKDVILLSLKYRTDLEERVNDLQMCDLPVTAQDPLVAPFQLIDFPKGISQSTLAATDPLYAFMSIQV